jgi:hypothetical protein
MRIVLSLAGIAAIVLAFMYFTMPAGSLPLPDALGHQAGSSTVHVKHGIAALVAAVACFVLARRTASAR